MEKVNKELRQNQKELERWKSQERDHQEKINEDAKELDKMTNKQSLLLKKVLDTYIMLCRCTKLKEQIHIYSCLVSGVQDIHLEQIFSNVFFKSCIACLLEFSLHSKVERFQI